MNDNEINIRITGTHSELKSSLSAAVSSAREAANDIRSTFSNAGESASASFKGMKSDISKVSSEISEMARNATGAAASSARAWAKADDAIVKLANAQAQATREIKAAKAAYEAGETSLEQYNASLLRTKSALSLVQDEHRQAMAEFRKPMPAAPGEVPGRSGPLVGSIGSVRGTLAGIGIAVGVNEMLQLGSATVRTASEFERLRAVLVTLEGSESGATSRFADLKKFATETPYELSEVVQAFSRLKSQGLDPSNESLRSYGNTASAMGKSITQMIEAVSDAVMGENERLKEFGIKARDNGDTVIFTFKGISTEVKKTSADIQNYLLNIGKVDFAGAMERQMKTLGGAFSNLKDSASNFADEVGQGGLSSAIQQVVKDMTSAGASSGALARDIGKTLGETVRMVSDIIKTFGNVASDVFEFFKDIVRDTAGKSSADFMTMQNWLKLLMGVVRQFADTVRTGFAIVVAVVQSAINAFVTFANVAQRAMRLDMSGMVSEVEQGVNRQVDILRKGTERINGISRDSVNAQNRIWGSGGTWYDKGPSRRDNAWWGTGSAPPDAPALGMTSPGAGGASRGRTGRAGAGAGAAEDTRTGEWRDDLQDRVLAEEKAGGDLLSLTERFWREKLAISAKGSKEEKEVARELIRAQIAMERERSQEDISALRHMEEMDSNAAEAELDLSQMVLDEQLRMIDEREAAGQISTMEAIRQRAAANQEILRLDTALENRLYTIRLDSLSLQRNGYGKGTQEYREYTRRIEALEAQHQQRMRALDAQGRKQQSLLERQEMMERTRLQRTAIQNISQSWASTLSQMMTLQIGFGEGIRSLWQGVQQMIANALASIIQNWLTQKLTSIILGKAMDQMAGAGQIAANAAIAGSAAYASTAAIPIVGPALAPAAAATAYAGAMAFQGLLAAGNSFDVGAWNISQDQFARVHANEMVIPADMAGGMRNLFRAVGGSNDNGGARLSGLGGGSTNNFHIHAMDAKDVRRLFLDHKGPLAEALRKYARDGGR